MKAPSSRWKTRSTAALSISQVPLEMFGGEISERNPGIMSANITSTEHAIILQPSLDS
jgi:hypothetical protein